jgi:hypothetical protein
VDAYLATPPFYLIKTKERMAITREEIEEKVFSKVRKIGKDEIVTYVVTDSHKRKESFLAADGVSEVWVFGSPMISGTCEMYIEELGERVMIEHIPTKRVKAKNGVSVDDSPAKDINFVNGKLTLRAEDQATFAYLETVLWNLHSPHRKDNRPVGAIFYEESKQKMRENEEKKKSFGLKDTAAISLSKLKMAEKVMFAKELGITTEGKDSDAITFDLRAFIEKSPAQFIEVYNKHFKPNPNEELAQKALENELVIFKDGGWKWVSDNTEIVKGKLGEDANTTFVNAVTSKKNKSIRDKIKSQLGLEVSAVEEEALEAV